MQRTGAGTAATQPDDRIIRDEAAVMRKVTIRLVPFMILQFMICQLDRINIGYAALTMNKDLSFTPTVFGFGASIFFFGYILFQVPSNLILHRVGVSNLLSVTMVAWGVVSMGMAFISGPTSFYVVRFLLGLTESGFTPGITLFIVFWIPLRYRARFTSLWLMSVPLAGVVGGPLSGLLLQLDGALGFRGWQWLFLVEGLPAVILGIITFYYLTPSPAAAAWMNPAEREWLARTLEDEAKSVQLQARQNDSFGAALVNWRVLTLGVTGFLIATGIFGIQFWLPTIIKSFGGLSNLEISFVSAIPYAVGAIASIIWSRYSDRSGERYRFIAIPLLLGAIGYFASGFVASPLLGIIFLTLTFTGIWSCYPVFWTLPGTFLTRGAVAAAIGLITAISNCTGLVSPTLVGWIRQSTGDFTYALDFLGLCLVGAEIIALAIRPTRKLATQPAQ
jgi:MFS transporter, ACS family, tartrate transporter